VGEDEPRARLEGRHRVPREAGLLPYLEKLGFNVVGYGCTTCIGNSGQSARAVSKAIDDGKLVASAVLSGNRNFEGAFTRPKCGELPGVPAARRRLRARRHDRHRPVDRAARHDTTRAEGLPQGHLASSAEVAEAVDQQEHHPAMFEKVYADAFKGRRSGRASPASQGDLYKWDEKSTYVKDPPYFLDMGRGPEAGQPHQGARVLALLGDSITTDHISPAGSIKRTGPRASTSSSTASEARLQLLRRPGAATTRSWCAARSPTSAEEPAGAGHRGRRHPSTSPTASER
jgi:aconitate hydratase